MKKVSRGFASSQKMRNRFHLSIRPLPLGECETSETAKPSHEKHGSTHKQASEDAKPYAKYVLHGFAVSLVSHVGDSRTRMRWVQTLSRARARGSKYTARGEDSWYRREPLEDKQSCSKDFRSPRVEGAAKLRANERPEGRNDDPSKEAGPARKDPLRPL